MAPFPEGPVEFLCECGDPGCAAKIEPTHQEWDFFAGRDGCLLLASAHTDVVEGRVVGEDPHRCFVAVVPD